MIAPILFLDIDGVLNNFTHTAWMLHGPKASNRRLGWLDPAAVDRLNRVVSTTGCRLVLSSTWRIFGRPIVQRALTDAGLRHNLWSETPWFSFPGRRRGHEIQAWLNAHRPVERFVILDDDADMLHLHRHLVQTRPDDGLTNIETMAAIRLLSGWGRSASPTLRSKPSLRRL